MSFVEDDSLSEISCTRLLFSPVEKDLVRATENISEKDIFVKHLWTQNRQKVKKFYGGSKRDEMLLCLVLEKPFYKRKEYQKYQIRVKSCHDQSENPRDSPRGFSIDDGHSLL